MESSLYYLKEFGREEFQEKFFFGRIYAGKLCIIKHNLEYQLQKHSKKKILEKNRSHCKHIQITIPGNLLKKC